jgi:hypothetical protein
MPNSLKIAINDTLVVLTPEIRLDANRDDSGRAMLDTPLSGQICLKLVKPTRIKTLCVDLVRPALSLPFGMRPSKPDSQLLCDLLQQIGQQEITLNGIFHAYDILRKHLELKISDEVLPAGEHM